VKYLPLFHHFKAIYQFPKHIIFLVKIVANAPLTNTACYKWYTTIMYVMRMFIGEGGCGISL